MYSHDSFGLGHLSRCRSIALSLVSRDPALAVTILSGLPLATRYPPHPQIGFRLLPGIIKQKNGSYRALSVNHEIEQVILERSCLIRAAAEELEPQLFVCDKEPLGVRGEMHETLTWLRGRGVPTVLGLRDVMDSPRQLADEWRRKGSSRAIRQYYDEIWVYGVEQIYDPLRGVLVPSDVRQRMVYTSYLRRVEGLVDEGLPDCVPNRPFLLVTPGGGGDGDALVDWVLRAVERDATLAASMPILIITGPFMSEAARCDAELRATRLPGVAVLTFVAGMERLMMRSAGILAMGGYNTFCEILSFNKPALIVPRMVPRMEQYIRAERAAELGLLAMLVDDGTYDPEPMIAAIRALPTRPLPADLGLAGLLDGHEVIAARVDHWIRGAAAPLARQAGVGD
jgi:predicted glycosyltransferase